MCWFYLHNGSTQLRSSWLRGSMQRRKPHSTKNLVFQQLSLHHASDGGQCTSCTGRPHSYNNPAFALKDRKELSTFAHTFPMTCDFNSMSVNKACYL